MSPNHRATAPSSFEARGIAVPFTTPALTGSRVRRDDRDRLEVLIPSLAGTDGVYILPLRALPDTVSLTHHDRILHDSILANPPADPMQMRAIVLDIALSGAGGADLATAATTARDRQRQDIAATAGAILFRVVSACTTADVATVTRDALANTTHDTTRDALSAAAAAIGRSPDQLYQSSVGLADTIAPVGLPWSGAPGILRDMALAQATTVAAITTWYRSNARYAPTRAAHVIATGRKTSDLVAQTLARIDTTLHSTTQILSVWPDPAPVLAALVSRLAWLLDGWMTICQLWDMARSASDGDVEASLTNIHQRLPPLPTCVIAADAPHVQRTANDDRHRQHRTKCAPGDWRSAATDAATVARIQTLNARALNAPAPRPALPRKLPIPLTSAATAAD